MLLLRVMLPDRPGSLGAVATAMGSVGADISAIEIVEKGDGFAINDFMVTMPPQGLTDSLVSACTALEGVSVLWLSRYPESWGLESDIDTVDKMAADPSRAVHALVDSAPRAFHCQWALAFDAVGTEVARSPLAPECSLDVRQNFVVTHLHATDLPEGWIAGWGDATIAVAPLSGGGAVVLGRQGGPSFLSSELRRLQHLTAMAAA